ncbi:hypothetical protein BWQ96_09673 [Gracilariopsis chorda]|uniref:Prolyl 4-hydroxylase alpha subunit domain-containing protein n=1 Tax=Gracilariopsis chorda TaxID=448386 RepID=A0A2V3IHJ7_9FLOR|nr:hypothetical protein BWQ96_09673 [Gracilariopsis chorda]|eukprot:PXF40610.1 hypothetical protein BWQ96_09673 [Gracilariopsis chorda]
MALPDNPALRESVKCWGLNIDSHNQFAAITALNTDPPLLRVPNFLTPDQCEALIAAQTTKNNESNLYLNYRINQELNSADESEEAAQLIQCTDTADSYVSSSARSGFRAQVHHNEAALQPVLQQLNKLLGFEQREFVFAEELWIRPTKRTVVIRDVTTVRYYVGEGVPPHVDGKDCTVLICLQEPDHGGRTVFPEDAVWVAQTRGTALVYHSKKQLLHFAEAVEKGTKWVLQLLIDFRVRADELDVHIDYKTGAVTRHST